MEATVMRTVCSGCLAADSGTRLVSYTALDPALITSSNCPTLMLCARCRRLADVCQRFLENVRLARALLESVASLAEDKAHIILDKARLQMNSISNLKIQPVHTLNVVTVNWEDDQRNNGLNVVEETIEVKEEQVTPPIEHSDDEDFGNDDHEPIIIDVKSEEIDADLLGALKTEMELEEVNGMELENAARILSKPKLKSRTKKKSDKRQEGNEKRKKKKSATAEKARVEAITLTPAELRAELERERRSATYARARHHCESCVKPFRFGDSYARHMLLHAEGAGREPCDVCGRRVRARELRAHRAAHYRRYRCGECGLTRRTRTIVAEHYAAVHAADTLLQCAHCPKSYLKRSVLRKHIMYRHGTKQRIPCRICSKTFAQVECLREHVRKKHNVTPCNESERRYPCAECDSAFRSPSHLRAHAAKHSSSRDYYCVECDRHFKTATILRSHLNTASAHVDVNNLPLGCDHCEQRFATKRAVQHHIAKTHLNIKPHKCDQCNKAYASPWSLREHCKLIHEGFKKPLRFPCNMCDKVFTRNVILQGHLRTHTGERPYRCPKCPATFNQSGVLHTHNRLIHLRVQRNGAPRAGRCGRDVAS